MVALLVGLRLRQLGRTLTRSPWAIASTVLASLGAVGLLGMMLVSLSALRATVPEALPDALVLLGGALVVGWAVGATLVASEEALAPERFSMLPVPARRLLPGALLAGALGVGGVATALGLVLTLIGWSVEVAPFVAALLLLPVQLATCVLAGRAVTAVFARTLANRRARDVVLVIGTILLIFTGLILQAIITGLGALTDAGAVLSTVAEVLAWTPLAAAWGVPHALASGAPLIAVAQLLIALATLALLAWVWGRDFARRLTAPVVGGGGGRVRAGGWLDRLLPANTVGAIAARGVRYRRRDPRHLVNLLAVVLLPALLLGMQFVVDVRVEIEPEQSPVHALSALPVLLPAIASLVLMTVAQLDAAYDGSALAAHVHAGVRGKHDRAGRALGIGVLYGPLLVVACIGAAAIMGRWDLLPASLGITLGTGATVVGVGLLIGAWMPGQAPAPDQSPFGRGSSGGAQAFVGMLLMVAAVGTVGLPAIGTAIAALWMPWLGWVSLGLGLVVGALSLWLGIAVGGRAIERRWPEVYAAVSREP